MTTLRNSMRPAVPGNFGEQMEQLDLKWALVITLSAAVAGLFVFEEVTWPVRPIFVLWFLAICPGMAYIQLLKIKDIAYQLILAVMLSLMLDLLIAFVVLQAGFWSPKLIIAILIILTFIGVGIGLFTWHNNQAKLIDPKPDQPMQTPPTAG